MVVRGKVNFKNPHGLHWPNLADKINEDFVGVMQEYNPLSNDGLVLCEDDEPISVTVDSVAARLSKISTV